MRWPFWAQDQSKDKDGDTLMPDLKPDTHQDGSFAGFTTTQTITASVVSTTAALGFLRLYKAYLRRIPNINYLKPERLRKRSLFGYVTSVGDGDNFHLLHTPGGRLAGWGWLRGTRMMKSRKLLKENTHHIRIAGIDAPEMAHFGRPEQPYGKEALEWLRGQLLHRYVRAMPYRRDQYDRVVCMVHSRKWLVFKTDVGLEMIKRGLATVYEAKFGSEFGSKEEEYRAAEELAKKRKVGMWQKPGFLGKALGRQESTETPREYKKKWAKEENEKGT